MLAGEGAIAIWNGIAAEGRADFYAWHLHEHMPERVGIPGFVRGRRYRAADASTEPEFFTLYETESFEVILGKDYADRLNNPTAWTRNATAHFLTTTRSLARVAASFGVGCGGALATLRFDSPKDGGRAERDDIVSVLLSASKWPEMTGAHLLEADDVASRRSTVESQDRADIEAPASRIIILESCSPVALTTAVARLQQMELLHACKVGIYLLEYARLKTAFRSG